MRLRNILSGTVLFRADVAGVMLPGVLVGTLLLSLCASPSAPRAARAWAGEAPGAGGETTLRVCFVGNRAIPSSRLRSLCSIAAGLPEAEVRGRVEEAVLGAYRELGYLKASIESTSFLESEGQRTVAIRISEGEPVVTCSFHFAGNRSISSEELTRACGIRPGMILTPALLDGASERLVAYMAGRGFPFAAVKVGRFGFSGNCVEFSFVVEEGSFCTIGDVRLEDSDALNSRALRRALGLKRGEPYSEQAVIRGISLLRKTGLFADVGEPAVRRSGEDVVEVSVPVKERKTTSVLGALGFRGRTNELTGGASLSLLNVAHTGRSAKVGWEAMGSKTSSLRLSYTEPWTMGLPFSSSISFEHITRDTLFARTSLSLLLKVPISHGLSGEIGGSLEKALDTNGPDSRMSRAAWIGGLEFLAGEPAWLSENSLLLSLGGTRGSRKTVLISDGRTQREIFSTLTGRTLFQRRLLANHVFLVDAEASGILEGRESAFGDELFPLGGKTTLRGYSERQFLASTVGSIQFEYGLVVGNEGGRVFGFLDCGYASTQALSRSERIHVGYGIGLRVPSLLGLTGIDLGIPAGESLGSGKIHVGLESAF